MQMLTGFCVMQIAGAEATYSIADHLAEGPATAEQIASLKDAVLRPSKSTPIRSYWLLSYRDKA